jgi:hypothetical protein
MLAGRMMGGRGRQALRDLTTGVSMGLMVSLGLFPALGSPGAASAGPMPTATVTMTTSVSSGLTSPGGSLVPGSAGLESMLSAMSAMSAMGGGGRGGGQEPAENQEAWDWTGELDLIWDIVLERDRDEEELWLTGFSPVTDESNVYTFITGGDPVDFDPLPDFVEFDVIDISDLTPSDELVEELAIGVAESLSETSTGVTQDPALLAADLMAQFDAASPRMSRVIGVLYQGDWPRSVGVWATCFTLWENTAEEKTYLVPQMVLDWEVIEAFDIVEFRDTLALAGGERGDLPDYCLPGRPPSTGGFFARGELDPYCYQSICGPRPCPCNNGEFYDACEGDLEFELDLLIIEFDECMEHFRGIVKMISTTFIVVEILLILGCIVLGPFCLIALIKKYGLKQALKIIAAALAAAGVGAGTISTVTGMIIDLHTGFKCCRDKWGDYSNWLILEECGCPNLGEPGLPDDCW